MSLGILIRKLKVVDEKFGENLVSLVFNIVLPCVVLTSFMGEFSEDVFSKIPLLLGLYALHMILQYLCAFAAIRASGKKDGLSSSMLFATVTPNHTFMGLPIISELLGNEGVICLVILMIPARIHLYTVAPLLMAHDEERESLVASLRRNWKSILNPATIAIPISFLIYLLGVSFPDPVQKSISSVASLASPLGMMLCGVMIAELPMKDLFRESRVILMVFMRNIAVPAIVFLVLWLLRIEPLLFMLIMIFCSLPIASITIIYAMKYDRAPVQSSMAVFLSTVLSVVTVPLWVKLVEYVLITRSG